MGKGIWVRHTINVERNSVIERLPHVLEVDEVKLVVGEIQDDTCLVLRALSAQSCRILWRDRRFGSDGQLVVYPKPRCGRLTTLDLRLNCPKGLGRLRRRRLHLSLIGSRLMTGLAAALEEQDLISQPETGLENPQATMGMSE